MTLFLFPVWGALLGAFGSQRGPFGPQSPMFKIKGDNKTAGELLANIRDTNRNHLRDCLAVNFKLQIIIGHHPQHNMQRLTTEELAKLTVTEFVFPRDELCLLEPLKLQSTDVVYLSVTPDTR